MTDATKFLEGYYTDTEKLLAELQELATSPRTNKPTILIWGGGGSGKTSILLMLRALCHKNDVAVAVVDGRDQKTQISILDSFSEELKKNDVELKEFAKDLAKYYEIQAKLVDAIEKRGDGMTTAMKQAAVPGAAIAGLVSGPAASAAVSMTPSLFEWVQKYFAKPDAELYLKGTEKLTEDFLRDTKKAAKNTRLVVMIDTYERMAELDEWVLKLARRLDSNILLVIASRNELGPEWPKPAQDGHVNLQTRRLPLMSDDNVRLLIRKYYKLKKGEEATDEKVDEIVRFAKGLPLAVTIVVDLLMYNDSAELSEILPKAVDQIIKAITDYLPPDLRNLLELAATLRSFNKEALLSLGDGAKPVDENFDHVIAFTSFVQSVSKEGYRIHDVIRDKLEERKRTHEPAKYRTLHEKAAAYYKKQLTNLALNHAKYEAERQRLALEIVYHEFQVSTESGLAAFKSYFEDACINRRDTDFCRALLGEAKSSDLSNQSRHWIEYYEALMFIFLGNEQEKAKPILEKLHDMVDLAYDLRLNVLEYLAGVNWYFGLRENMGQERARRLYSEALGLIAPNDHAARVRFLIWEGILNQRTKGTGEISFNKALAEYTNLGPEYLEYEASIKKELSICYRMQGRFGEALTNTKSGFDIYDKLGLQSEKAGILVNWAMLSLYRGKLDEADQQLNQCQKLLNALKGVRPTEWAWVFVGVAEVALARGDYQRAWEHIDRAKEKWKDDVFGAAVLEGEMADMHCAQGNWDDAIKHADESIGNKQKTDKFGLGLALYTKGAALLGKGRRDGAPAYFDDAIDCLKRGLHEMTDYGSWFGQSKLTLEICEAYYCMNKSNEFWENEKLVRGLADKYGFFDHRSLLDLMAGFFLLRDVAVAKPPPSQDSIDQIISYFSDALFYALKYNVYLLDRVVNDVISNLKNLTPPNAEQVTSLRKNILADLRGKWGERTDENGDNVTNTEMLEREKTDEKHKETVAQKLEKALDIQITQPS